MLLCGDGHFRTPAYIESWLLPICCVVALPLPRATCLMQIEPVVRFGCNACGTPTCRSLSIYKGTTMHNHAAAELVRLIRQAEKLFREKFPARHAREAGKRSF